MLGAASPLTVWFRSKQAAAAAVVEELDTQFSVSHRLNRGRHQQVAIQAEVVAPRALVTGVGAGHEVVPDTVGVGAFAQASHARVSGVGVGYREEDDVPMLMEIL